MTEPLAATLTIPDPSSLVPDQPGERPCEVLDDHSEEISSDEDTSSGNWKNWKNWNWRNWRELIAAVWKRREPIWRVPVANQRSDEEIELYAISDSRIGTNSQTDGTGSGVLIEYGSCSAPNRQVSDRLSYYTEQNTSELGHVPNHHSSSYPKYSSLPKSSPPTMVTLSEFPSPILIPPLPPILLGHDSRLVGHDSNSLGHLENLPVPTVSNSRVAVSSPNLHLPADVTKDGSLSESCESNSRLDKEETRERRRSTEHRDSVCGGVSSIVPRIPPPPQIIGSRSLEFPVSSDSTPRFTSIPADTSSNWDKFEDINRKN